MSFQTSVSRESANHTWNRVLAFKLGHRGPRLFLFVRVLVCLFQRCWHNYIVKWKEPNRPQKPNRPQFLEGRFGTCGAVLDRKSQNSSRWYQFGPSNFWIGYTKSYFGTSSQFGPSDSQIKIPIWPQQGLLGATAFCRQKGRKETAVLNHSQVWHNPKYGPFSRVRN